MLDPMSLAAVSAAVQAVAMGAATEAGKQGWESLGALTRRLLGREVPAPETREERDALAGRLRAAVADEPALARELARWVRTSPGRELPSDGAVPHLLPATTRHFTDRTALFRQISEEARRRKGFGAKAVLLYGPEGVGASAVGVHWGERYRGLFPDGQLYADLRGASSATAVPPAQVLRGFLVRLGVPEERLPATVEDRRELYRELIASRRLLVVLDHVHSSAEAAPFLTSAPGVLTLLVGHRTLPGLDARALPVGPLAGRDAARLLTSIVGKSLAREDRSLIKAATRRCAGFPLALTAVGQRMLDDPGRTRSWAEAQDSATPRAGADAHAGARVHADADDPVAAVVELSSRGLSPEAARLCRLLAQWPWPDFGVGAAAAAARLSEAETLAHLAELSGRRLLEHDGTGRYRFRLAVREQAERAAEVPDGGAGAGGATATTVAERTAAVRRMIDWYLRFAVEADHRALPQRWRLGPLYRAHEGRRLSSSQSAEALRELRRESAGLVEAVRAADAFGEAQSVLELCEALWALVLKTGLHDELLPALRIGARTADEHCPGTRMAGRMHTQLAYALGSLERFEEAEEAQRCAAAAEREAGHRRGEATALEARGVLRLRQWRYEEAVPFLREADEVLESIAEDEEGAADVPRARAILVYHLARASRGLGRRQEALDGFTRARRLFAGLAAPDRYNEAKALTGVAGTHLDGGDPASAVALLDEALAVLEAAGGAELQRADIAGLRSRCAEEREI